MLKYILRVTLLKELIAIDTKEIAVQIELIKGFFAVIGIISPILLTYLLQREKKKNKRNPGEVKTELKYHPVFARIESYKSYLTHNFQLQSKGKKELFRHVLMGVLETRGSTLLTISQELETCISKCDVRDITGCNKLYNLNMKYLYKAVDMRLEYFNSPEYTDKDREVIKIVLDKFNKWDESRTKQIESSLLLISSSRFYNDCHTRQAVIFDMYLGVMADMINDAEKTLNEINGDLNGTEFKGLTI